MPDDKVADDWKEIDIEGAAEGGPEIVVDDAPAPEVEVPAEAKAKEAPAKKEETLYPDEVKIRINKLQEQVSRSAEAANAERQRREQLERQLEGRVTIRPQQAEAFIKETRDNIASKFLLAKQALQGAIEAGDSAKQVEAQIAIVEAQAAWDKTANMEVPAPYTRQQQQQKPSSAPAKPALPPKARSWIAKNSELLDDAAQLEKVKKVSAELESIGFTMEDDEFYSLLDSKLKKAPTSQQKMPLVSSSSTNGAAKGGKVRLTSEEVQMAKRLGVSLQDYAKHKVNSQDQNGYSTIAL